MSFTFLQIFLLVNIFIIGGLAVIAAQHAYAHFRPHPPEPKKPRPTPHGNDLPPEMRERLLQASEAKYQSVLDRSATELQRDLDGTAAQLNRALQRVGTEIVGAEVERYRAQLTQLRTQAESAIGGAQSEIAEHQAELRAELAKQRTEMQAKLLEEMAAEKQLLMQQLDTKLADAVASFLTETLQHNVDLGAQSAYLTAMLDEHKAELTKGTLD